MLKPSEELVGIVSGQYGVAVPITIVDEDGLAVDITAYTSIIVKMVSFDTRTTLSFTASIVSATAGVISFTPSSSNTFDRDGVWTGQIEFSDTGILAITPLFKVNVDNKI